MSQFMVEIQLPFEMNEEFMSKIPQQRQTINELMKKGKILSYSLAADRQKLWCIVKGENELEVMAVIGGFPLIDHISYTMHELMFNNTVAIRLPLFSLN